MEMDGYVVARVLHVAGVVLWIGGVAMVTMVLLPMARSLGDGTQGVKLFHQVEQRFAWQSRLTTLLTGFSGFYMLHRLDGWHMLFTLEHWWVTVMFLVWTLFTLMLFVLEPLYFRKHFMCLATAQPGRTIRIVQTMHWILLSLSFLAIAGAVAGAHGGL